MDIDLPHGGTCHSSTIRTSNCCWNCRLRREKCDENHPECNACAALHITCHYDQEIPAWMDGGFRQEEMAKRLKREVKEKAHRRRGEHAVHFSGDRVAVAEASTTELMVLPQIPYRNQATPRCNLLKAIRDIHHDRVELFPEASTIRSQRGADCTLTIKDTRESIAFGRSDTILLLFYLEHLFPFLFPFYNPSLLQGDRAWILEMMISSPVVRQAMLCQSSYFSSLARRTSYREVDWEKDFRQTRDAFGVLRESLQVIYDSGVIEHLHGAVRILAGIMQIQRFEIAVLSFDNCQAHLTAAIALFQQLLDSTSSVASEGASSSFNAIITRLGPLSWNLPPHCIQAPSAEQAAFCFSSSLLILDDIIASTVLQKQPRLYEYHSSLLGNIDSIDTPINLEAAIGCQNWVLLHIGEIAVLDVWKQQCKRAGNLDVIELVHRATTIKKSLEGHLIRLKTDPVSMPKEGSSLLDFFRADFGQQSNTPASQSPIVTSVWAHAALIYLLVVVSGWQPASSDVRYHVGRTIELLTRQISSPALLRTMVWPFCVAGCLAEPIQEPHFHGLAEALQPPSIFGTVRKALKIMENVWRNRNAGDISSRDLAMCFAGQSDLVLLV